MPMPVSRTVNRSVTRPSREASALTVTTTISPCSVNFTALLHRFSSTWPRRSGSPRSRAGTPGAVASRNSRPLRLAASATSVVTLSSTSCSENSSTRISSLPDSIFEKSRMSLMIVNNDSAAPPMRARYDATRGGRSGLRRARSVMPMMAFIGVRISWLMLARNELLASLAASAARVATDNASVRSATRPSTRAARAALSCVTSASAAARSATSASSARRRRSSVAVSRISASSSSGMTA